MLADLCPCFHQSPTRPNFGRSRVKVCPILCRLRTKLCPNFGCSRARLYPISFAPCPFPNLAGTLYGEYRDGLLVYKEWLVRREMASLLPPWPCHRLFQHRIFPAPKLQYYRYRDTSPTTYISTLESESVAAAAVATLNMRRLAEIVPQVTLVAFSFRQ